MEIPKSTIKDFFLYLFIIVSLSVSLGNVLAIVFSIIDKLIPDSVASGTYGYYYVSSVQDAPRLAIASLIVLFPLFVLFSWLAAREIKLHPERKEIFIRRGYIFLALFISLCSIVATFITTIYLYLGGELSMRFAWKALALLIVAGVVFGYYFYTLHRDYTKETKSPVYFLIGGSFISIGVIVWSIMVFGTPSAVRAARFDDTRISNLQEITSQIETYTRTKGKLPQDLAELARIDQYSGYSIPLTDPENGQAYVYSIVTEPESQKATYGTDFILLSDAVYQLCATFNTRSIDTARSSVVRSVATSPSVGVAQKVPLDKIMSQDTPSPYVMSWSHDAGNYCFTRMVIKN